MSLKAITWVLESAPVKSPAEQVVLYALADRAHDDGSCAWPSQSWLAARTRLSARTVRRHLAEMEGRGLIRRGDQRLVAHIPSQRRPVVWDLVMTGPDTGDRSSLTGQNDRPDTGDRSRPDTGDRSRPDTGVLQTVLKNPPVEPSLSPYSPPASAPTGNGYPDAFEDWYATYPVRKDKQAAFKAWQKVAAKIGETNLMQALVDRLPQINAAAPYIKYPATWLNKGGWQDDIEAPTVKMTQNDKRQQAIIDAANQLFAEEVNHDRPAIG